MDQRKATTEIVNTMILFLNSEKNFKWVSVYCSAGHRIRAGDPAHHSVFVFVVIEVIQKYHFPKGRVGCSSIVNRS
jgi:hypothetical protein